MSFLEVKKVSLFFGGLAAIKDISFSLAKGEILGLIGPNGAGKTTLFNVVNGFYKPSRGDVLFKDQSIAGLKPHRICRRGLARTFQVVKPLQRMSVYDNIIASAFLRARVKKQAEEIARDVLGSPVSLMTGTSSRKACRSGRENGSRSPGRSPHSRSFCCSTSPLPA